MAVENKPKPKKLLNTPFSLLAGAVSAAVALGGIVGSTIYLAQMPPVAEMTATVIADMVLLAIVFLAGVQLMLGKKFAQRLLLVVFLAVTIVATTFCLSVLLSSVPQWWDAFTPVSFAMVMIPLAGGSFLITVLLVLASTSGTRLRYASITGCSVAAAIALVVAVNMIAQTEGRYKRFDIEQLNVHGLSQRTKKILSSLDEPIKITCVYAPLEKKARELAESKYRPRLMSMLKEMREYNSKVEIVNASSDVDKAEVVTRLAGRLNKQSVEHSEFVENFLTQADIVIEELLKQQNKWGAIKETSYLSNWAIPARLEERIFGQLAEAWQETRSVVKRKLASKASLVDYAELIEEIMPLLERTRSDISDELEIVQKVVEVPDIVKASQAAVLKAIDEAVGSVKAMSEVVGSPGDPPPVNALEVLKKFVIAAEKASVKIQAAGDALNAIGQEERNGYALNNFRMLVDDGRGIMTLGEFFGELSEAPNALAVEAKGYVEKATPEAQLELVNAKREELKKLLEGFNQVGEKASDAIKHLTDVDEPTKKIFAAVKDGSLFEPVAGPADKLFAVAEKLPELKTSLSSADISGDNIVVIETGDKVEIVSFDDAWPRRSLMAADDENNRYFDGDQAVGSRILTMTQPLPFAVVMMASFEPEIAPEMARFVARPDISARDMSQVTRQLEKANIKVVQWNLANDMPEVDEKYKDLPRVLLVLPPAQVLTQFGASPDMSFAKEHAEKIIAAIDGGISAVILTRCDLRVPSGDGGSPELNQYLRDRWGVEAKTGNLVFPGQPDETEVGKYLYNEKLFLHFPLSTFTDHPIGRPLQGNRMLWLALCPVVAADKIPSGVTVEDILVVGRGQTGVWATSRLQELGKQINARGSLIEPDYDEGDMAPPFSVVVAAVREGGENFAPTRVVVMGAGNSFTDGYLARDVDKGKSGTKVDDPPRDNPDIILNSVYWASGNEYWIAAGPMKVKPIEMFDEKTENIIKVLVMAGLPLMLVALGGLVLYVRRR